MSLELIDLRIEHNHPKTSDFTLESKCIAELYWSFLKDYDTNKVKRCNIVTSDNWGDNIYKYTNWSDTKGINIPFDFDKYFSSDNQKRKRLQLEAVHCGMMKIAEIEKWDINPLLDAHNSCLKANLEYSFILNKYKSSPNRKFKINFKCYWDIDEVRVFYILCDKKENILNEEEVFAKPANKGELVYHLKWKWINNHTVLLEDKYLYGDKESWEFEVKQELIDETS